ncbi:hypothetical protein BBJ28_00006276 [Nothophytophthora sp. Chile5]|nr:hypothetical protein BBJ28_00006276 [Nothophytophthora sp. Chile5]
MSNAAQGLPDDRTNGQQQKCVDYRSLRISCPLQPRRRTVSWSSPSENTRSAPLPRPASVSKAQAKSKSASASASPSRVRFLYNDEATRARVCSNAQRLIETLQKDPEAVTTGAQVARKALKFRRLMGRLNDVDPEDPDFDVSAFLGIEWCRVIESTEEATETLGFKLKNARRC